MPHEPDELNAPLITVRSLSRKVGVPERVGRVLQTEPPPGGPAQLDVLNPLGCDSDGALDADQATRQFHPARNVAGDLDVITIGANGDRWRHAVTN